MTFDPGANTYLPASPVVPMSLLISNISNGKPMIITVNSTNASIYVPGQLIYLSIPRDYGMYQANALTAEILFVNGLNFSVDVDSTNFDPFVIPSSSFRNPKPAALSPAGSRNIYNFTNVPFHSLGNTGN